MTLQVLSLPSPVVSVVLTGSLCLQDEVARVMWNETEATSSGYQWRVHAALDTKFYELVTKRGPDEGSIRMKPRVKAPRMAKTKFTVTSTARISGHSFHATSDVYISVVGAKDASGTDG